MPRSNMGDTRKVTCFLIEFWVGFQDALVERVTGHIWSGGWVDSRVWVNVKLTNLNGIFTI